MSNEAVTWAYTQDIARRGAKFLLVTLADFADQEWSCFPSQELLAARTAQTSRSVRRHLAWLEEAGFLVREKRGGNGGGRLSDRYRITPATLVQDRAGDTPTGPSSVGLPDTVSGEATGQFRHGYRTLLSGSPYKEVTPKEPSLTPISARARATRIPANFMITTDMRSWAEEHCPDVDVESQSAMFCDHHAAKASTFIDWRRAWQKWMRQSQQWQRSKPQSVRGPSRDYSQVTI